MSVSHHLGHFSCRTVETRLTEAGKSAEEMLAGRPVSPKSAASVAPEWPVARPPDGPRRSGSWASPSPLSQLCHAGRGKVSQLPRGTADHLGSSAKEADMPGHANPVSLQRHFRFS